MREHVANNVKFKTEEGRDGGEGLLRLPGLENEDMCKTTQPEHMAKTSELAI